MLSPLCCLASDVPQLLQQMPMRPDVFQHFREAPLLFAPTYKYDPLTLVYDTGSKARAPAWCDRVLFACSSPGLHLQCMEYGRSDILYRCRERFNVATSCGVARALPSLCSSPPPPSP